MLINVKMPAVVGILTFMSMIDFVHSWVENEKGFITSGLSWINKSTESPENKRNMGHCTTSPKQIDMFYQASRKKYVSDTCVVGTQKEQSR